MKNRNADRNHLLIDQLASQLTPTRPLMSPLATTLSWFVPAFGWLAFSFLFMNVRTDLNQKIPQASFVIPVLGLLLSAVLSAFAVCWLSRPGRARQGLAPAIALSTLLLLVLVLLNELRQTGSSSGSLLGGVHCFVTVVFLSLLPVSYFFLRLRRAAPTRPGLSGAFIGLASAAMAASALALSCSDDHPAHWLAWHLLLPWLTLGVSGLMVGRKLLKW